MGTMPEVTRGEEAGFSKKKVSLGVTCVQHVVVQTFSHKIKSLLSLSVN